MSTILRCKVLTIADGSTVWVAFAEENEVVGKLLEKHQFVFAKNKNETIREDKRKNPPFFQILPCPWCGVKMDKDHVAAKHIHEKGKIES